MNTEQFQTMYNTILKKYYNFNQSMQGVNNAQTFVFCYTTSLAVGDAEVVKTMADLEQNKLL